MTPCIDHGRKGFGLGYATAWRRVGGLAITTTLHRAVFYDATGQWPEVVRHKCDNARCINLEHLEAGTQLDNVQDMHQRGRSGDCRNFSTANGRCVLTDAQAQEIRDRYEPGNGMALSREYGISRSQVGRIVRGEQRDT